MAQNDIGFRPIGNPATKIVNSLDRSGSTPTGSNSNSGSIGPAAGSPGRDGRELSRRDAKTSLSVDPRERTIDLAACLLRLGSRSATKSDFAAIQEAAEAPAERREVIKALTKVRALTAARSADTTDLAVVFAAMADELAHHPGDLVLAALAEWPRREKWWPSLREIVELMRRLDPTRYRVLDICAAKIATIRDREEAARVPPTDEEKAAVSASLKAAGIDESTLQPKRVLDEPQDSGRLEAALAALKRPREHSAAHQAQLDEWRRELGIEA